MVRTYKRKRNTPEVSEEEIQKAIEAVQGGMSLRVAADLFDMHYSALFYRVKKAKSVNPNENEANRPAKKPYNSKYTSQQVFTADQETMLSSYLIKCSALNYGLTYRQVRQLAHDYAERLNTMPNSWKVNKIAGIDWVQSFMKRHPQLTLRKPENTSLARSTAFNITNVTEFFDNYERALRSGVFQAEHIYNIDETGVSTVVQAPNVVAKLGARQVGQAVSGERGTMVTMCMIINAVGNTVPPVFIFPRAKFHDSMLFGAPPGSLGLVNSPKSGWMTGALFLEVLKHIKKHTGCSKENKIILTMDNHDSHCTLDAVVYAKDNGMVIVTFPPHCSHRLQPLDVGVLGPFKSKLRVAQNDWMVSNPGKTISIHNLAALANTAYAASFTIRNITAAFKKPGIWPFDRQVFTDEDFEASSIHHVPANATQQAPPLPGGSTTENLPSTSKQNAAIMTRTPTKADNDQQSGFKGSVTPEDVRPYPKAATQKKKNGRKRKKSAILTWTPEKNRIEEETLMRLEKKRVKLISKVTKPKPKLPKMDLLIDSSDSESADNISLHDESDYEDLGQLFKSTTLELEEEIDFERALSDDVVLNVNDFVLVEFAGKREVVMYVGQIEEVEDKGESYKVKFMRKNNDSWKFYFPAQEDSSSVERKDIKMKLPQPNLSGGTARAVSAMTFSINLSLVHQKIK